MLKWQRKSGFFSFFINQISKPHPNLSLLNQTQKPKAAFSLMSFASSSSSSCCYHATNAIPSNTDPLPKKGFLYNNRNSMFVPKTASIDRNGVIGLTLRSSFESQDNKKNCPPLAPPPSSRVVFVPHQHPHQQNSQLQLFCDLEISSVCEEDDKRLRHVKLANGHGGGPLGFSDHQKVVVAVDVDEVLGNFVSALNRFIADRYSLNHSVSEYHVYEFFRIWNCTRDEADIRVHEFFKTHYFKKGIHPIPGARKALDQLSRFCNLSVVTSRQNAIKDHTIEWIEKHYPGLFQEIHFGNHFALDGESKPKSEICRSLGAKILIDDNPRYALECAEVGIRVLLFDYENSYPWCKTDLINQHPLVTKVHNWEEIEEQLVSWIIS